MFVSFVDDENEPNESNERPNSNESNVETDMNQSQSNDNVNPTDKVMNFVSNV